MRKIASIIIAFLVIFSVATLVGGIDVPESDVSVLDEGTTMSHDQWLDVPTWKIGTSWTYQQDYWSNETDPDAILQEIYVDEEFTYTVSGIETFEVEGVSTPVYNVTIEGDVFGGEGVADTEMGTLHFKIESGEAGGYMLFRMDDLGTIVDHRYKEMDMSLRDYDLEMYTYTELTTTDELGVEIYDFPLDPGRHFWANTTLESTGYSNVIVGDFDETRQHEDVRYLTKKIHVSEEPIYDNTYEVTEEISGDDEGTIVRHYDKEAKRYVELAQDLEVVDINKRLEDHELPTDQSHLYIEPANAYVGQTVTVNGSFPDNPDEEFDIMMPTADVQETIQTDSSGHFTLELEVPDTSDNTPAFGTIGSHGVIARSNDDPLEAYQVATLSVLHPEALYTPWNPRPHHGAENVYLSPTLEVEVEHVKRLPMDVTFYDASDDSEIGTEYDVESGETVSLEWHGRDEETEYEWYTEVHDGSITKRSDTWTFTTGEEGAAYNELFMEIEGEGSITPLEGTHRYRHGEEVTIQAVPDDGWDFIGWSGDHTGHENETTIVMDQNYMVTAHFERDIRFEVEILSPDPNERFNTSEEITLQYKVTNTREQNITSDILIKINDEIVESNNNLTLSGGEEFYGNFTIVEDESGRYNIEIASDSSSDSLVIRVDSVPSWWENILLTVGIAVLNNCLLSLLLLLLGIFILVFLAVRRWKKRSKNKELALKKEKILSSIHKNRKKVEKQFNILQDKFEEADDLNIDIPEEKGMFVDIKYKYHSIELDEADMSSLKKARSDLTSLKSSTEKLVSLVNSKIIDELESINEEDIHDINNLIIELEDDIEYAKEKGNDVTELQEELERVRSNLYPLLEDELTMEEEEDELTMEEEEDELTMEEEEDELTMEEEEDELAKEEEEDELTMEEEEDELTMEEEEDELTMEEEEDELAMEEEEDELTMEEEITKEEALAELKQVEGIGASTADLLYENGFRSLKDIRKASKEDLQQVKGIGPTLCKMIMNSIKEKK